MIGLMYRKLCSEFCMAVSVWRLLLMSPSLFISDFFMPGTIDSCMSLEHCLGFVFLFCCNCWLVKVLLAVFIAARAVYILQNH